MSDDTQPITDEDRKLNKTTLSGKLPGQLTGGAPQPIDPKTGMHGDYWVLSAEERAKGFVRPVRRSYKHVGPGGPKNPLRDLTEEEIERHGKYGYIKYEKYPENPDDAVVGRFWTQKALDDAAKGGCGSVTTMNQTIAETYARDPKFYGSTFCVCCGKHLPVAEFVWADTAEVVGS